MPERIARFFRRNAIAFIIAGFVILASTGLFYNFGLATTVNDETQQFGAALRMIGEGTLRPAFPTLGYPPLAAYVLLPFALLSLLAPVLSGAVGGLDALREFVIVDFALLLPFARAASVIYAALTLFVFYRFALRIWVDRRTALFATCMLASSLLFVQLAHFGRVWSPQLLAIVIALWASMRLDDDGKHAYRRYLIAAAAVAASFGINVIGAVVYVAFAVGHVRARRTTGARALILYRPWLLSHAFLVGALVLFYWLNPFGYANYLGQFSRIWSEIPANVISTDVPVDGLARACDAAWSGALGYYVESLLWYDPLLLVLGLAGVLMLCSRHRTVLPPRSSASLLPLGVFSVVYLVAITALSGGGAIHCEPRYAAPLLFFLAACAALPLSWVSRARRVGPVLVGVVMFVVLLPVFRFDILTLYPSTRVQARDWILEHVPEDAAIIALEEKLDLPESAQSVERILRDAPHRVTRKRVYLSEHPERQRPPAHDIYYPSYVAASTPGAFTGTQGGGYAVLSWWTPEERERHQGELLATLGSAHVEPPVMRFPRSVADDVRPLDLPNNMVAPVIWLWRQPQNGPVIEIYKFDNIASSSPRRIDVAR